MGSNALHPLTTDASRASSAHSSLKAPHRDQSISVDEVVPTSSISRPLTVNATASSESDDDENDNVSRRQTTTRKRKTSSLRPSSSALSLESSPSESDMPASGSVHAPPPSKRRRVATTSASPANQIGPQNIPSKRTPVPGSRQSTVYPPQAQVTTSRDGVQPSTQVPSSASVPILTGKPTKKTGSVQVPTSTNSVPRTIAPAHPSTTANVPASSKIVVSTLPQTISDAATNDYELVNIYSLPDTDMSGWDRFIFFAHRPQRFQFATNRYLSSLSPFSAVTSDMDGVSIANVCAVCGAGGTLSICSRCQLGFHNLCIDQTASAQNRDPWLCAACLVVMGNDRSKSWHPQYPPKLLPPPSTGLLRLTADATEGNPIDHIFNPSLFNFYIVEAGGDWLRCVKCRRLRTVGPGVLSESVHVPFDCTHAFWLPAHERLCAHPAAVKYSQREFQIEQYLRTCSRRRCALFAHFMGEEDREDFGYPPLQETLTANDEVIVIEEDGSWVYTKQSMEGVKPIQMSAPPTGSEISRKTHPLQSNTGQHPAASKPAPQQPASAASTVQPSVAAQPAPNQPLIPPNPLPDDDEFSISFSAVPSNMLSSGPPQFANSNSDLASKPPQVSGIAASAPQAAATGFQIASLPNLTTKKTPPNAKAPSKSQMDTPSIHGTQPCTNPQAVKRRQSHPSQQAGPRPTATVSRRTSMPTPNQSNNSPQAVKVLPTTTGKAASAAAMAQLAQNHTAQPLTRRQPKLPVQQNVAVPNAQATRGRPAPAPVRRLNGAPASRGANVSASTGANNALARSLAAQGPVTRKPPAQLVSVNAGVSNAMVRQVPVSASTNTAQLVTVTSGLPPNPQATQSGTVGSAVGSHIAKASSDLMAVASEGVLDLVAELGLDEEIEDQLTDMALAGDKSLLQLYKAFGRSKEKFKRHASRLAQRKIGGDVSGVVSTSTGGTVSVRGMGSKATPGAIVMENAELSSLMKTLAEGRPSSQKHLDFNAKLRTMRGKQFKELIALHNALASQMSSAEVLAAAALYAAQMEQLRKTREKHEYDILKEAKLCTEQVQTQKK